MDMRTFMKLHNNSYYYMAVSDCGHSWRFTTFPYLKSTFQHLRTYHHDFLKNVFNLGSTDFFFPSFLSNQNLDPNDTEPCYSLILKIFCTVDYIEYIPLFAGLMTQLPE